MYFKHFIRHLSNDFLSLFYPNLCLACNQPLVEGEHCICLHCLENLAKTDFHLHPDNRVEMSLAGRVKFERATAFCFFKTDSSIQHMIHNLKYNGNQEIGEYLGELFGEDLIQNPTFASIDVIVPIPIHPKKKAKRGYNQSEAIGRGLAKSMKKPLDTQSFIRTVNTSTQTKKSRYSRWENVAEIFFVKHPENLENKHILLIDDVITTGATIESAAHCLLEVNNTKISIACLACASN
jgi:ComF family protein